MSKGAYRVRFIHLGVDGLKDDRMRRPLCRPAKTDFQMTQDHRKVTCHQCKERMEFIFNALARVRDGGEIG